MAVDNFVHLHAHTSIGSMQDAMTNVDAMFKKAAEFGQPALAITDHGTMAAVFDARKASKKYGVKYIPGIEAYFVDDAKDDSQKRRHIVLLAQNEIGYKNLLSLNYKGYCNFQFVAVMGKVFPRIDWALLKEHCEGVICLTACGSGLLSRQMFVYNDEKEWTEEVCDTNVECSINRLKDIFGENLYLEVQPHSLKILVRNRRTGEVEYDKNGEPMVAVDQAYINRKLARIGKKLGVKIAATADVHYLNKDDAKIHDMLMAISSKAPLNDKNRHRYEVEEFYMKNRAVVFEYFNRNFNEKFANYVCDNTVEIANKCTNSDYLDVKEPRFPKFNFETEDDAGEFGKWLKSKNFKNHVAEDHAYMRFKCEKSFKKKYGHLDGEQKKIYIKRMMDEIKVLEMHNFCSYMLIVADFIRFAKSQNIMVGPGRGSVGGSLVGNLLGIHAVDPIKYGLIFERFHNKEKKAFPDIDSDFSSNGRDAVEQYIVNKYGKNKVAHVSNLSKMTPKVIIKDIARSLELGGSKSEAFKIANKITDTISKEAQSIDEAQRQSKEFTDYCRKYPELESYGRKLVGLERAYATHAAGIVISDIDLSTYVPLRLDKNGVVSVQYEKNRCEEMGLIKMDLLGLEHLRIIENTIINAEQLGMQCPKPDDISFDDKNVWDDLSKGKTMCVFQMGSAHMKALCKQIKPQSIEDLSLVNALGRPSAVKSRQDYIARRNGLAKITYKHECLKLALEETLGVCVYEDQLMKLANVVSGWDLNKADGLRKLTKYKGKNPELVTKLREDFISGAVSFRGMSVELATEIWEEIVEPFEGYGFNKPHGIFYSINGYHTAYYKHYFPAAFMAAVLQAETNKNSNAGSDNINAYKKEAQRLGLRILQPDINSSDYSFKVLNKDIILTGLDAVKGVGESAIKNIMEVKTKAPFKGFADFLYRTNSRVVRKDVIQALAQAGCFDKLGITRKAAFTYFADIRTKANKYAGDKAKEGIDEVNRLHGFVFDNDKMDEEWAPKEKMEGEYATLGEFISGSWNDVYNGFFTGKGVTPLTKIKTMNDGISIRTESIISDIKEMKLKNGKNKGKTFVKCTLTDPSNDAVQLTVWPEQWTRYRESLDVGKPIRAVCKINMYNGANSLVLERLE